MSPLDLTSDLRSHSIPIVASMKWPQAPQQEETQKWKAWSSFYLDLSATARFSVSSRPSLMGLEVCLTAMLANPTMTQLACDLFLQVPASCLQKRFSLFIDGSLSAATMRTTKLWCDVHTAKYLSPWPWHYQSHVDIFPVAPEPLGQYISERRVHHRFLKLSRFPQVHAPPSHQMKQ